ncbi:hypothetical protein J8C02_08945 [Chloracidobacterium sp. MS 40/45]|uniref:hypothetical protein n=1 Tax=Chloracidobacterium aggregatum TaxID=2851959 RepID=UPI001B8B84E6|nr:hypothetical protein [Chloracidobacterium aggregatum]QUV99540.1 hypothetical protein J8C02_08945 [Chloracidobacterium sp. MS 40/45]
MARFTETDEAAQLLQQILSMSTAARPPHPNDAPAYWDENATNEPQSGDESVTMALVMEPDSPPSAGPAPDMPPPPVFPGTVIRELVTTHAGQVQLTLHASPQHAPNLPDGMAGSDGETVADFFRRVVRPFPNADLSAT